MLVSHILQVAVKLAPQGGSIGFECTEDKAVGKARFVFRHSGNSLPEGREEKIFDNFMDYKSLSENGDAALILVRMINFLTNSSLKSTGHQESGEGAKLVFMLPLS